MKLYPVDVVQRRGDGFSFFASEGVRLFGRELLGIGSHSGLLQEFITGILADRDGTGWARNGRELMASDFPPALAEKAGSRGIVAFCTRPDGRTLTPHFMFTAEEWAEAGGDGERLDRFWQEANAAAVETSKEFRAACAEAQRLDGEELYNFRQNFTVYLDD